MQLFYLERLIWKKFSEKLKMNLGGQKTTFFIFTDILNAKAQGIKGIRHSCILSYQLWFLGIFLIKNNKLKLKN